MSWLKRLGDLVKGRDKTVPAEKEPKQENPQQDSKASSVDSDEQNERIERIRTLTPRECEVMRLLLEGKKIREIADQLGFAYATGNFHTTGLYKKLGINSRPQLFLEYTSLKDMIKEEEDAKP